MLSYVGKCNLLKLQLFNLLHFKQLYVHYMYPTVTRKPWLQLFTPMCNPLKKVITTKNYVHILTHPLREFISLSVPDFL